MNQGGRPKASLHLNDDERQKLQTWSSRPKSTQRLATRAGSSWLAPRAWTTARSLSGSGSTEPPSASGGADSSKIASKGWPTSPGPAPAHDHRCQG